MAYGDSNAAAQVQATPQPRITPLSKPFWDLAERGIYAVQTCDECGDTHVPETPVCPRCLSSHQSWRPASGRGTLESWADFHRAYWDGFSSELPYRTCVIRLAEGPLIVSNLVGDQSDIRVGAGVHVVFERASDGVTLPKFVLDRPAAP